jgi:hypothetical protein
MGEVIVSRRMLSRRRCGVDGWVETLLTGMDEVGVVRVSEGPGFGEDGALFGVS